jgi:hypothetical protein
MIEPAQVVARHVFAMPAELDPRAAPQATVRARIHAVSEGARAQAQRSNAPPIDRALSRRHA